MENKLCIYAICKNEERNIDSWMDCALEADCIFLLDTGSTDGTWRRILEWQELPTDRFQYMQWIADGPFRFDTARNQSIIMAETSFNSCNIFITTDLDERLEPGWADLIRENWDPDKHQRCSYSHALVGSKLYHSRNWCHAKGWRWKYPCHEVMTRGFDGDIWYQPHEALDLKEKLIVWHHKDQGKNRAFYLDLLKLRWEEYQDKESLGYLTREYMYRSAWQSIIDLKDEIDHLSPTGSEACMCYRALGDAYSLGTQDSASAELYYKSAIAANPNSRDSYLKLAQHYERNGNYKEALSTTQEGLERSTKQLSGLFTDDASLWTWRYLDWMGVFAYKLRDPEMALHYFSDALMIDPGNAHVWRNVKETVTLKGLRL